MRRDRRRLASRLLLGIPALVVAGCAARQRIPLDCIPQQVTIYVDGRMLEGNPDAVELRLDEPHKVYVKAPGYAPQLVVLEPRPGPDGELTLPAEDVCVELVPVGMGRNLELQIEE